MRVLLIALLACSLSACASAGSSSRTTQSFIDEPEIRGSSFGDAFSLVQALRPQWLSTRGATSFAGTSRVLVYLDGSRLGGVGELRQISTRSLRSLRFLGGVQAQQQFGLDHGSGAIVATSRNSAQR